MNPINSQQIQRSDVERGCPTYLNSVLVRAAGRAARSGRRRCLRRPRICGSNGQPSLSLRPTLCAFLRPSHLNEGQKAPRIVFPPLPLIVPSPAKAATIGVGGKAHLFNMPRNVFSLELSSGAFSTATAEVGVAVRDGSVELAGVVSTPDEEEAMMECIGLSM